jgi:hypothetical protein
VAWGGVWCSVYLDAWALLNVKLEFVEGSHAMAGTPPGLGRKEPSDCQTIGYRKGQHWPSVCGGCAPSSCMRRRGFSGAWVLAVDSPPPHAPGEVVGPTGHMVWRITPCVAARQRWGARRCGLVSRTMACHTTGSLALPATAWNMCGEASLTVWDASGLCVCVCVCVCHCVSLCVIVCHCVMTQAGSCFRCVLQLQGSVLVMAFAPGEQGSFGSYCSSGCFSFAVDPSELWCQVGLATRPWQLVLRHMVAKAETAVGCWGNGPPLGCGCLAATSTTTSQSWVERGACRFASRCILSPAWWHIRVLVPKMQLCTCADSKHHSSCILPKLMHGEVALPWINVRAARSGNNSRAQERHGRLGQLGHVWQSSMPLAGGKLWG